MRILVFSDSHQDVEGMAKIVAAHKPDMLFHLGDHYADAAALHAKFSDIPLRAVMGNCDFRGDGSLELLLDIEEKRFLLCHGHAYQVKMGLGALKARANQLRVDLALFGHTHVPLIEPTAAGAVMNPGRAGRYLHNTHPPSYASIDLSGGALRYQILYM